MADQLYKLLDYIVEHRVMVNERLEAQMDATATQDIQAEIAASTQDQRERAQRLAPYFARGLRMAQHGPLRVEDTSAEESLIAEAFATYLVAQQLASSASTPLDDNRFSYVFDVNWPLVTQVAQLAEVDLRTALASNQ